MAWKEGKKTLKPVSEWGKKAICQNVAFFVCFCLFANLYTEMLT